MFVKYAEVSDLLFEANADCAEINAKSATTETNTDFIVL